MTPYMTITEAANYARRSVKQIYRLTEDGTIASYKPDGKVLIRVADMDAWIKRGERKAVRA